MIKDLKIEKSRKSLVSSRKFDNEKTLARSAHNELTSNYSRLTTKRTAFTMAEILLSLTIIGVVAAITLPSLTGNINERTWNTQRKALYSRISQAISLMQAINGYGTINDTTDTATETFVTAGLSKVLKINNICATNFSDCGIPSQITNMAQTKIDIPTTLHDLNILFSATIYNDELTYSTKNTNAVAFETQNGESIVAYYNQSCKTEYLTEPQITAQGEHFSFFTKNMCLNFVYDLNGKKGPNTVGKDIGVITVFNATDSITVAPVPSSNQNANNNQPTTWENAIAACRNEDNETRLPNADELASMHINKLFFNMPQSFFWSSTSYNNERAWEIYNGVRFSMYKNSGNYYVRCIKR